MDMGVWLCNQSAELQGQPSLLSHMKSFLTPDHGKARGQIATDHMGSRSSWPAQKGGVKPRAATYLKIICLTVTCQALDPDYTDIVVFLCVLAVCVHYLTKLLIYFEVKLEYVKPKSYRMLMKRWSG